ncbi:ankyrin repeat domain-containing protein [Aspergillus mulundensis]|uniref:Uncharacterized protein n=1 Tax=Aspergillus mulundensis TaxID=1810919 RepID=A0A3D8T377_9EURO|nr:hypothetical protein DSM5745_00328 [Aspergillus mulundensis]RDW93006.1 hypothetical protein DSM5745_00328 [Aspergillus mulundensis]
MNTQCNILSLPVELLLLIWADLDWETADWNALTRTCRSYYNRLNPILYDRVINECGDLAEILIIWAVSNNREACVTSFLRHGADPGVNDKSDVENDRRLSKNKNTYHMPCSQTQRANYADTNMYTPLSCAARRGNVGIVRALLAAGAKPNAHGGLGDLPIIWAVERGHTEIVLLLLNSAADFSIKIVYWESLLGFAIAQGYPDIVKMLRARDPTSMFIPRLNLRHAGRLVPTTMRARRDNVYQSTVQAWLIVNTELLPREFSLAYLRMDDKMILDKLPGRSSVNLLHKAVAYGYYTTAEALLIRGAPVNSPDEHGLTPLAIAMLRDDERILQLIFSFRPDIILMKNKPNALLFLGAIHGSTHCVRFLLSKGIDANIRDEHGFTPLCIAVMRGHVSTVDTFLSSCSQTEGTWQDRRRLLIDAPDRFGRTPLFFATIHGFSDIVCILLRNGSNAIQSLTCAGRTPLSFAAQSKHMLLDKKRNPTNYIHEQLRTISQMLERPSSTFSLGSTFWITRDLSRRDPVAPSVQCLTCAAVISHYDDALICPICTDEEGNQARVCPECRAMGTKCHI